MPIPRSRLLLPALFLLVPLFAVAARKPITLEDVAADKAEPAIAPVWRPDGLAFAYQSSGKVYFYDVASKRGAVWFEIAPLTARAKRAADSPNDPHGFGWQNRRVSSSSLQWFPNNRDLLVSTGGDLFIVHPDARADQLTATPQEEEDAKLSPDGASVLYRSHANLFVLEIGKSKITQLTFDGTNTLLNGQLDWVYPEELDLDTASWWSPDSRQIAYLRFDVSHEFVYPQIDLLGLRALAEPERYPQAGTPNALVTLGVVPATGGKTTWMDVGETSNTLLARVRWLPNAAGLAVERLSRVQDQLDLLIGNPSTGATRTLLHEQSKTWINLTNDFFFLKSRPELLWTSERDGFRHLYRYSLDGKLLAQITKGDWQIDRVVGIDEEKKSILYTSTEASPLEQQLYRVGFDGGERTRLTASPGVHEIASNGTGSFFLDRFSNLTTPPATTLHGATGESLAVLQPARAFDEYEVLPSEIVTVPAADGTPLYGRLIRPAGFQPGWKYPAVVLVYGGPGVQTVRNAWLGLSLAQVLAHRGYVVWQLDNRGSINRGHAFEEPTYRELGAVQLADQHLGVDYLVKLGFVNPKRIGIYGWSFGGYMTIYSLLHAPGLFRAGVAGAPVTDWHNYDTIYTERYLGLPGENKSGYDKSSNVLAADKLQGKLFLIHNVEDDNVLFQNTMQMINALETAGKPYEFNLYPQKSHGVTGPLNKTMLEALTAFFDRNLKAE